MKKSILSILLFVSITFGFAQVPNWYVPVNFDEGTNGYTLTDNHIDAFIIFNGELYVGGRFTTLNGSRCYNVGKLVGSSWVSVGKENDFWELRTFEIYHGELYAGGKFGSWGGVKKWNGISWEPVGMTETQPDQTYTIVDDKIIGMMDVHSLKVYRDKLYAGGETGPVGKPMTFMKWNGKQWSSDGYKTLEYYSSVDFFEVFQDELYMSCGNAWVKSIEVQDGSQISYEKELNKFHPLLKWNGTNYIRMEIEIPEHRGTTYFLNEVKRMRTFNGELYISYGDEGIYRFDGSKSKPVMTVECVNDFVFLNNKFYFSGNREDILRFYDNDQLSWENVSLTGNLSPIIVFNDKIYGGKMIKK